MQGFSIILKAKCPKEAVLPFYWGKEVVMKKIFIAMMLFGIVGTAQADEIFFEGFDDSSGIIISGNASYWGIAPLEGTSSIPSGFIGGGSQSGFIFYGSNGYDSTATMTINLPDLTGYKDLRLILSLAAPDGARWENTHRDSLIISGTSGVIDSFLPYLRGSPLRSQVYQTDLHYYFQDFEYVIDSSLESLTFNFASTAGNEVIGIDSVTIIGIPPDTEVKGDLSMWNFVIDMNTGNSQASSLNFNVEGLPEELWSPPRGFNYEGCKIQIVIPGAGADGGDLILYDTFDLEVKYKSPTIFGLNIVR